MGEYEDVMDDIDFEELCWQLEQGYIKCECAVCGQEYACFPEDFAPPCPFCDCENQNPIDFFCEELGLTH